LASGAYALRHDVGRVARAVPEAAERARELVRTHVGEASTGSSEPQPVGTSGTPSAPGGLMQRVISSIVGLAGHLVVIFFLVLFLLIFGQQARKRIIEISGDDADERRVTATIFDDIHAQIQRFLLVLLFTATVVALATWGVLAAMKVEHAAMWALLAGIFNSIPYFGPVIVSGGLFIVGLVQGGDVTQAVWMAGAALAITSLEGWLLTPPLMGKAERMSALAVFLGLLLFTWLWGPWGTVLAVPMLVVIKSVADHVDRLKPLGRLMAP
jgi:predicted PurR-regulated permease PerM